MTHITMTRGTFVDRLTKELGFKLRKRRALTKHTRYDSRDGLRAVLITRSIPGAVSLYNCASGVIQGPINDYLEAFKLINVNGD